MQSTIIHKISETNFSFHVKSILLVLRKLLFWQEDWEIGFHSMKFRHFPHTSQFPKILSFKSFRNSRGKSYIPLL